jgi:hypothetical protein
MNRHILGMLLLLSLGSAIASADAIFDVDINTTPLEGQTGYLAFDFIGGTPVEENTVTISDFSTNAVLGLLTPSGDVSGSLSPGPGTLGDLEFFNEFLQEVTFGTTVSFVLDLTTNATGVTIPDDFSFYLLDSTENPYTTSDPSGADSLVNINISGAAPTLDIYTSSSAAVIPEPRGISITLVVLMGALLRLRRRCWNFRS